MLLGFSGCTAQTLLAYWRALMSSNVGNCFFYVTLKRSASDMVHPASTPENPITAAYVLVIRDRALRGTLMMNFWTGTTFSGGAGTTRLTQSFALRYGLKHWFRMANRRLTRLSHFPLI
jgi:hypothetical protein